MNHKESYKERKREIAVDIAKNYYYKYKNWVRPFGFSTEEDIDIHIFMKFPRKIRKMPDFIYVEKGKFYFSEVKGCHDILRLKIEDLKDYLWWFKTFKEMDEGDNVDFRFFVFSTKFNDFREMSMQQLVDLIQENKDKGSPYERDRYPDNNKEYIKIPVEDIFNKIEREDDYEIPEDTSFKLSYTKT